MNTRDGERYLGVVILDPAAALVVGWSLGEDLDGRKRKFRTAGFHPSSPEPFRFSFASPIHSTPATPPIHLPSSSPLSHE